MPAASSTDGNRAALEVPPATWRERLACQIPLKVRLLLLLSVAFLPYLVVQRVNLGWTWSPPEWALDRLVPFDARWVWVYQSVYLPFALTPWLCWRRDQLVRYARTYLLVLAAAFLVFALAPSLSPERPPAAQRHGLYALVCEVDSRGNACPSLHAGLMTCILLLGWRIRIGLRAMLVLAAWTAGVFYSAIATRQHYSMDLLVGALLGVAADTASAWVSRTRGGSAASGAGAVSAGSTVASC